MASNILEASVEDLLDGAFTADDESVLVVDPTRETVITLVEAASDRDDFSDLSVLVEEQTLKRAMDEFVVASAAADLVADDALAFRILPETVGNTLFVSASRVAVPVTADDTVAALATDEEDFVEAVFETHHETFEEADPYDLRTPPISRVRETMAAEIGEAAREDFDAVLASLATDGTDADLDEVTVSLLVAARNEVLLYDVSKWGEDVGIASKATFSRTKTRLEDQGLIDTEKVPIDVGRPRLRLKLGDDRLRDVDADELASVAADLIA
ncbi:hypothetical protein GJ633_12860 [Halorubrum sp. CBA1125]|uniref:transcriptional regulator TbsP n=1 Tax=Halorubrum sp. CBA1125 TaxID=2668072 RepID=UPI0012E7EB14|nr:DUF5821 family protein [Halorubrum sp. CBA1125]MUW15428.1 hypothetical protein [Halorubrum sp. CBA1125]